MEVTLKGKLFQVGPSVLSVSILVLMEVTLKAHIRDFKTGSDERFNPCFNGSDSKSCGDEMTEKKVKVSILVLMEVTLKVDNLPDNYFYGEVSILVLMEVTLKGD